MDLSVSPTEDDPEPEWPKEQKSVTKLPWSLNARKKKSSSLFNVLVNCFMAASIARFHQFEEACTMMTTLNEIEARKVLQSARVARLGCIAHGEPYVVPISCYLEDDCLYSHSLPGRKISALRENPRACVQADEIESDLHWRSAIAFGRFEEITKSNEREEILTKLLRKFPLLTPVESAIAADASAPQVIVFRIRIERLTGVSEG